MAAELLFLTRDGCKLCDEAERLLVGLPIDVIDVDADPALLDEYDTRVPVLIEASSGAVLMEGQFDDWQVRQLRRALNVAPSLLHRWRRSGR
jgi:Glutaredoxin-like domain (DUF836)